MKKEEYIMQAAVRNFKKWRGEHIHTDIGDSRRTEVWASKKGGYLKMEETESGCTLVVTKELPAAPQQEAE